MPSRLGTSRVHSAVTVTFNLWSGMPMSVCEWRLVEIFENLRTVGASVNVIVGPEFGPERQASRTLAVGKHSQ